MNLPVVGLPGYCHDCGKDAGKKLVTVYHGLFLCTKHKEDRKRKASLARTLRSKPNK